MLESGYVKRLSLLIAVMAVIVGLSSCQKDGGGGLEYEGELFGDGNLDTSPVICRVNGLEITRSDLEMRLQDMPQNLRGRFTGDNWERSLLEYMIGEAILAQDAQSEGLRSNSDVSRRLITLQRDTMKDAYNLFVLWPDLEPAQDDLEYLYEQNKQSYQTQGEIKARHIQCATREKIDQAWEKLQGKGYENLFANVCGEFTENEASRNNLGELGWFARGGYVPALAYGQEFSERVFDWDRGLHEPEYIGGDWHIVEILNREPARLMTLNEVRPHLVHDLMPQVQKRATDAYVEKRRKEIDLEYFGDFRPGFGRTAEELLRLGMVANTPDRQLELYDLLLLDYPDSEYVPMALFMKANVFLDKFMDRFQARASLNRLVNSYPDSELREQAEYMLENMTTANFNTPQTIEELRAMDD